MRDAEMIFCDPYSQNRLWFTCIFSGVSDSPQGSISTGLMGHDDSILVAPGRSSVDKAIV